MNSFWAATFLVLSIFSWCSNANTLAAKLAATNGTGVNSGAKPAATNGTGVDSGAKPAATNGTGVNSEAKPRADGDLSKSAELWQLYFKLDASVTVLKNSMSTLQAQAGSNHCQMGTVGCVSNCNGNAEVYSTLYREYVTFAPTFSKRPDVVLAMNEIYQKSGGKYDWYGWKMYPTDVTHKGFYANIEMLDRKMTTFKAIWIACYYL